MADSTRTIKVTFETLDQMLVEVTYLESGFIVDQGIPARDKGIALRVAIRQLKLAYPDIYDAVFCGKHQPDINDEDSLRGLPPSKL